jgi:hypothetical protein
VNRGRGQTIRYHIDSAGRHADSYGFNQILVRKLGPVDPSKVACAIHAGMNGTSMGTRLR